MSYWSWSPSLAIGIDVIDSQHRRLVDYLNELDAARLQNSREKVSDVLTKLLDYTRTHFLFEEDMMSRSGYPLTEAHKKVHETFVAQLKKYIEQHQNGKDITRKLMSELQLWLTNHIKYQDADYGPYAKKALGRDRGWVRTVLVRLFG